MDLLIPTPELLLQDAEQKRSFLCSSSQKLNPRTEDVYCHHITCSECAFHQSNLEKVVESFFDEQILKMLDRS